MLSEPSEKWWIGYCFIINSVIGAGILGIPWAYYTAGWLLGILCQLYALLMSIASSYQILSGWSRVEAIVQLKEQGHQIAPVRVFDIFKPAKTESREYLKNNSIVPIIAERKFDLYEMTTITMGKSQGRFIILVYIVSAYPCLVAYLSIFSISLASNIPLFGPTCNLYDESGFFSSCKLIYWGYLSIFSAYILIISMFPVNEHKYVQVSLTIFRIFVFTLMILTGLYAIISGTKLSGSGERETAPALFELKYFGRILFIVIFASLYENIIPTATSFVKNKARDMPKIINSAIFTFNVLYVMVGLVLAFADKPSTMASLNWRSYTAGEDYTNRAWWSYIISYFIVLLPALDLLSSYPLVAINFSDNLMSIVYGVAGKKELTKVCAM